jgi:predicted nucleic acid-binding protein
MSEFALADTSMFIAIEQNRPLSSHILPSAVSVSIVTVGEIAATAIANDLPVPSQDGDYDDAPGPARRSGMTTDSFNQCG